MEFSFTVDKRRWSMWALERAEFDCGTPHEIEYGLYQNPLDTRFDESAMYRAPDFNKAAPIPAIPYHEREYGDNSLLDEEIKHEVSESQERGIVKEKQRIKRVAKHKKEDEEEFDWYNARKNDALQASGFLSAEDELKIALADEASDTIYIMDF